MYIVYPFTEVHCGTIISVYIVLAQYSTTYTGFICSLSLLQRYTYRVLQTIQMKLIFLCVWAELAVLGGTKTALKFKYEI